MGGNEKTDGMRVKNEEGRGEKERTRKKTPNKVRLRGD